MVGWEYEMRSVWVVRRVRCAEPWVRDCLVGLRDLLEVGMPEVEFFKRKTQSDGLKAAYRYSGMQSRWSTTDSNQPAILWHYQLQGVMLVHFTSKVQRSKGSKGTRIRNLTWTVAYIVIHEPRVARDE